MRRPLKQQLNDAEAKLKRRPQGIVVVGGGFPLEICMPICNPVNTHLSA